MACVRVLALALALAFIVVAVVPEVYARPRASKPHILFVVADDYGWNDIGYHSDEIATPNLDRLAASGIKLNNYYVQPLCTPTRAAIQTGRYPIRYGLQHYVIQPPFPAGLFLNETTLAHKMRDTGYATHAIGKWHLGFFQWEYTPTYRGFDSYLGYWTGGESYYRHVPDGSRYEGYDFHNGTKPLLAANGTYSSTWFEEEAIRVVENYSLDTAPDKKPLFMYLAMQTCHEPLQLPPNAASSLCEHLQDKNRRIFCTMAINMDGTVANVTQAFQKAGIWEDTLLIFTTDNGGHPQVGGSNWPLRGGKQTLWEGGVRGVAFVAGAGVPKEMVGTTNNELMHVSDWFPTMLNLVGANISGTFPLDGFDQWDTITKNTPSKRSEILLNIDGDVAALRSGEWKIIIGNQSYDGWFYPPVNSSIDPAALRAPADEPVYLFNITADPTEHTNLASNHPAKVKELTAKIEGYRTGPGFVQAWLPDADPEANPQRHGGMWVPWRSPAVAA